jgi:hypothetical protein
MSEKYRASSYSLWYFLHSPVTSSLLYPNILLNTLFSNTLSLRFPLKSHLHYKTLYISEEAS